MQLTGSKIVEDKWIRLVLSCQVKGFKINSFREITGMIERLEVLHISEI